MWSTIQTQTQGCRPQAGPAAADDAAMAGTLSGPSGCSVRTLGGQEDAAMAGTLGGQAGTRSSDLHTNAHQRGQEAKHAARARARAACRAHDRGDAAAAGGGGGGGAGSEGRGGGEGGSERTMEVSGASRPMSGASRPMVTWGDAEAANEYGSARTVGSLLSVMVLISRLDGPDVYIMCLYIYI